MAVHLPHTICHWQASGVSVADDCVTLFNEMKLKHTMKFIVYKMNDGMTQIEVLKTGDKTATYDDFLKELPVSDCRYGVFDVEHEEPKTKAMSNKLTVFAWSCSFH